MGWRKQQIFKRCFKRTNKRKRKNDKQTNSGKFDDNIVNSGNETDSSNTEVEVEDVPTSVQTNIAVTQEYTSDINNDINDLFFDEDEDEEDDSNNEDYVKENSKMDIEKWLKMVTQDETILENEQMKNNEPLPPSSPKRLLTSKDNFC